MTEKILPINCPACHAKLKIKRLGCTNCDTEINGDFDFPVLARLEKKEQDFVLSFVKHSGSLKEMAKEMNLSYPTVRNLLDKIIVRIKEMEI
jgi:hypothetical protein